MNGRVERKLNVTGCVGKALNRMWADPIRHFLLAVPLLLFSSLDALVRGNRALETESTYPAEFYPFEPTDFLMQIVGSVLTVMLFANVVRLTLLGPSAPRQILGLGWGLRETRIALRSLLILVLPALPAVGLIYLATSSSQPGAFPVLMPGVLVLFFVLLFLICRSVAYLMAPALDSSLAFRPAFEATRGNAFRVFLCFVLVNLPFALAGQAVFVVYSPDHWLETGRIPLLALVLFQFFGVLGAVATFLVLAQIYEFLFPRDEPVAAPVPPREG